MAYGVFFKSLKKSPPEIMGEIMKRAEKYIRLDDTLRIERQQDPRFTKKRVVEENKGEGSENRPKREDK